MLRFYARGNHRQMSDFVRECLDSHLEILAGGEEDIEEEYIKLLFPEFKWAESRDKCIKIFYEFCARLADGFLHETTELEWYILTRLYEQWEDILPDLDRKYQDNLNELEENFDGDCDQVAILFELYKACSPGLAILGYEDLDSFTELMPRDILQEYLTLKEKRNISS